MAKIKFSGKKPVNEAIQGPMRLIRNRAGKGKASREMSTPSEDTAQLAPAQTPERAAAVAEIEHSVSDTVLHNANPDRSDENFVANENVVVVDSDSLHDNQPGAVPDDNRITTENQESPIMNEAQTNDGGSQQNLSAIFTLAPKQKGNKRTYVSGRGVTLTVADNRVREGVSLPESFDVSTIGQFVAEPRKPFSQMTAEERKDARAKRPKLTKAQRAEKMLQKAMKLKAEAEREAAAGEGQGQSAPVPEGEAVAQ